MTTSGSQQSPADSRHGACRSRAFAACGVLLALCSLLFAPAAFAATFTVNNTNDTGAGSLRQAITSANSAPGPDIIVFNIGGVGSVQTIIPVSALPDITDPVTLDAWTQGGAGYQGPPLIKIGRAHV